MPKQVLIVFFFCFFCLTGMTHPARAGASEDIPAIDMPEFLISDDLTLVLSGSGIRRVLFMEPYAAGLYLQKTATGGSAVMTADEPVILRLHILAPMSRRMMVRSLYNGMVDAAESMEWDFSLVEERFDRLADSFTSDIDQGDIMVVYADHLGSAEYNRRLSERRAASAGDYLGKNELDPSRIHTRVYGSERRASSQSGETAEERAKNRRIDFRVLSYAPPPENGDEKEE